eukprot:TRINITY_DN9790_c0_g1_i1.p1 TRINITY_DN9790_c0_g1~~TRINITY_DN9790_c0_g1_i1.p1  ORF type:complete len:561 (-),score=129.05 TRINITY_DN9790_c0_g1_i1:251-1933(-)
MTERDTFLVIEDLKAKSLLYKKDFNLLLGELSAKHSKIRQSIMEENEDVRGLEAHLRSISGHKKELKKKKRYYKTSIKNIKRIYPDCFSNSESSSSSESSFSEDHIALPLKSSSYQNEINGLTLKKEQLREEIYKLNVQCENISKTTAKETSMTDVKSMEESVENARLILSQIRGSDQSEAATTLIKNIENLRDKVQLYLDDIASKSDNLKKILHYVQSEYKVEEINEWKSQTDAEYRIQKEYNIIKNEIYQKFASLAEQIALKSQTKTSKNESEKIKSKIEDIKNRRKSQVEVIRSELQNQITLTLSKIEQLNNLQSKAQELEDVIIRKKAILEKIENRKGILNADLYKITREYNIEESIIRGRIDEKNKKLEEIEINIRNTKETIANYKQNLKEIDDKIYPKHVYNSRKSRNRRNKSKKKKSSSKKQKNPIVKEHKNMDKPSNIIDTMKTNDNNTTQESIPEVSNVVLEENVETSTKPKKPKKGRRRRKRKSSSSIQKELLKIEDDSPIRWIIPYLGGDETFLLIIAMVSTLLFLIVFSGIDHIKKGNIILPFDIPSL